ncbi:MAG: hypothetical protein ACM3ZA_05410 [Bacillota bacterium]
MAGLLFPLLGGSTVPVEILSAQRLVTAVRQEAQVLLPVAQATGSASIGEAQLRSWDAALVTAVNQLGRVPNPLIFPPPLFITLIQQAIVQINLALEIIRSIPIAAPLIFPPQPGQAVASLSVLQSLLAALLRAEGLLVQAAQAAATV